MDIPLETLLKIKADTEQRQAQALADLNGIIGEMRLIERLITEAQKQPEDPEQM